MEAASGYLKAKLPDEVIPYKYLSIFTNVDIAVTVGEQNAKFNKNLEVYWKSRWTRKKDFPGEGRFCSVGFSIGDRGYFGTGENTLNYNKKYLKDFWEYDSQKDEWKRKADFPGEARSLASSFVLKDKGYIGSGGLCDIWGNNTSVFFNDYYKYDPATDDWTQISDYAGKPRYSAASFVINDLAYVGTGRISYESSGGSWDQSIIAKDFWYYNPSDEIWHEDLDFPYKTRYAKGFSIGNKGYLYESGKVKEYKVNSWVDKCSILNVLVLGEISFSIGNIGYILYGTRSSELLEINQSVDLIKRTTIPYETGIVASFAPSAFTIKDKAYIISGVVMYSNPGRYSQEVWEFDPNLPLTN